MTRRSLIAATATLALVLAACATEPTSTATPEPTLADAPPTIPAPTGRPDTTMAPASPTPEAPASPSRAQPDDPLLAVELVDVRSGEPFTLWELASEHGPVLLEPMAIWCSNCRAQQRQVIEAHRAGSFSSVSLDVDLSEQPEDLAAYADREGFDWHFAMADAELYRALQERFGVAVTNPPSTPLIIIEPDGSVRALEFGRGVRSADELLAELGAG
jgi:thiol-disulfide isomerase/thioredoxin